MPTDSPSIRTTNYKIALIYWFVCVCAQPIFYANTRRLHRQRCRSITLHASRVQFWWLMIRRPTRRFSGKPQTMRNAFWRLLGVWRCRRDALNTMLLASQFLRRLTLNAARIYRVERLYSSQMCCRWFRNKTFRSHQHYHRTTPHRVCVCVCICSMILFNLNGMEIGASLTIQTTLTMHYLHKFTSQLMDWLGPFYSFLLVLLLLLLLCIEISV